MSSLTVPGLAGVLGVDARIFVGQPRNNKRGYITHFSHHISGYTSAKGLDAIVENLRNTECWETLRIKSHIILNNELTNLILISAKHGNHAKTNGNVPLDHVAD